jgi:hypothetical protein
VFLWAWERPEDLRFIDTRTTGVAFLASTITLDRNSVSIRPRLQPILLSPHVSIISVVRIEGDGAPNLLPDQRRRVLAELMKAARLPGVAALQIDFDARLSQRDFYRDLLNELRVAMPNVPVSITALASWCAEPKWIESLPVDEAVPMLFRMGTGSREVHARLDSAGDFHPAVCRGSVGLSTDEPWPMLSGRRRVYLFSPQPWTPKTARKAVFGAQRWN